MASWVDVCRFTPTLGGTTDWTYSAAVVGCQSPSLANLGNNGWYYYRAESSDLTQWEIGRGQYNSGTGVLTRTNAMYNSSGTGSAVGQSGAGTKINFTVAPQVAIVALSEDLGSLFARSYLAGLTLSTAGASTTFSVAAGIAADSTNTEMMALVSALSKTTGAWAVGNTNGSFDGTGSAPSATAGWYHVHLIKRVDTGVVDVLTSNSAAAPTLPANYTWSRRIGSMKTNGSFQWIAFIQNGDDFVLAVPFQETSASAIPTVATLLAVTLPATSGIWGRFRLAMSNANASNQGVLVQSPDETSTVAGATNVMYSILNPTGFATAELLVRVNTSAQIRWSASTTGVVGYLNTIGWVDTRGKLS